MQRYRDDVFVSSQFKRPTISRRLEQPGKSQMSTASSAQRLTTTDALLYLKNVKEIFHDRRDKYEDFLDVMKDFKSQRIHTSGVILRVKELFKGHRDLILGFNTFLPKGYEITLPPEDEPFLKKEVVKFEEAISFVNNIKARFQGNDHLYKTFLSILNTHREENKSITEVSQEVAHLFQDHADLLVEFTHFLPETSGAASIQYAESVRNHIVHGDDRGSPLTMTRFTQVDKKPAVFDGHVYHQDTEQFEKEKEKGEDQEKIEWELDDSLGHKRKLARHDDCAINQFHRGMMEIESDFHDKVKDRLQDPLIDRKFSDCIRSFKSKFVTAAQFRKLVTSLLGTHTDVSEACEDFLTCAERNGSLQNNKLVFRSLKVDRDVDDHDKEDGEKNKDHDFRVKDRHDRGLASNTRDFIGQKIPSYASKEKFMSKSIQDLDLSNSDRCTPSYRLLPENYPIPSAKYRTKIGAEVLNDHWVSVTSGSEDYSFKHMRKNQYEESLSRCEDDRFELDMLLESVKATTKRVEELLDKMKSPTYKIESSFSIEEHLSALHLRCIERLYGDHGLDVMDVIRKNAPLCLPVIFTRLKQKQEEWEMCRADFNKVWAEIYAKNYHKSLDYRSFHFKHQDPKNLTAKALLAEIKEMDENNQNEDEVILSIAAGYAQPTKPHMEFEYSDLNIQEDIYQLVQYSFQEVCMPEQRDKVMKIWTTFLEPLLCVPSRPPSDIKQNLKHIGQENSGNADVIAYYCKPADMPKSGDEHIPPEDSLPNGARVVHGNNWNVNDGSTNADNIFSKSDMLCKSSPTTAGEKNTSKENPSATWKETGQANADCGTKMIPKKESQDDTISNVTKCSIDMVLEEVKNQKHHEENETWSKVEREEGEVSPNRNLEENIILAFGNTDTIPEQTLLKNEPTVEEIREEEIRIEEEGEKNEANGDDGGGKSVQFSSDTENVTESGDVSGGEFVKGEECSPEGLCDDGDHNKNDRKDEFEGDVDCMTPTQGGMPDSDHLLQTVKPLTLKVPGALMGNDNKSHIFYGNDSFYLLFRLHQMLYERMLTAKLHSSTDNKWRISNDANSADSYARFKNALYNLLNGSSDNAKFEDECRALVGAQSYILFTLDKLIHKLVKQIQIIATEEMDNELLHLYAYERSRRPEKFSDMVYYANARFLLPEDNVYRIEFLPAPMRLTMQLMKNEHDNLDPVGVCMDPNFASYLNDEFLSVNELKEKHGVFMKRNKKLYSNEDECSDTCKAMEGLVIHNGVEMKINSISLKISYVMDTEDFMYRSRKRRRDLYGDVAPYDGQKRTRRCKFMLN